ncbi:Uncharacterised protein [Mycobacteroides abscessus]|nr:Uncharacterised protein [Mycobacteroides abscessus]
MPSVVMNDGTLSSVVTRPLTSPTARPKTIMRAMTGQVIESSPSMSFAAMTTWAPTSEPTDRSNSPETMTKYCPIARMTSGAAFLTNAMSDIGSPNDGFITRMTAKTSTSSANTVQLPPAVRRSSQPARGARAGMVRRVVSVVMRTHLRCGSGGSGPGCSPGRSGAGRTGRRRR